MTELVYCLLRACWYIFVRFYVYVEFWCNWFYVY